MRSVPYTSGLSSSLRDRGWSQIWCQNRQFADPLPLNGTHELGMIQHPDLGNDFADQLSMTEKPHHRTLRDDNSYGFGNCAHVGGGDVTAAESQRDVHLRGHGVEVAARGKDNSGPTYDEPTIQLRQFLDGSAEIEMGEVARRLRMPNNGSKINSLDLASTAFSSPSVNGVPTRLPPRPSRAISTATQSVAQERPDRIRLLRREYFQTSIGLLASDKHEP
jgi:hypothetical protein